MHYITNDWKLGMISVNAIRQRAAKLLWLSTEELLIDFRELVGKHSGENLAEAVWQTMGLYGLRGRVCHPRYLLLKRHLTLPQVKCINCDNASNNDTMMDGLETLHAEAGLEFDAQEARLRCMPHTVHLSALEECGFNSVSLLILTSIL
jgi:hypothetical protein